MRVGVYIDGFNLYYGGRGLCGKGVSGWRWLDVRALAARLVTNHSAWTNAQNERVIYCTAAISGADNPVGNREQDAYLRALTRSGSASRRGGQTLPVVRKLDGNGIAQTQAGVAECGHTTRPYWGRVFNARPPAQRSRTPKSP